MKQSDLDNFCYSFIIAESDDSHMMTIPDAAYTLSEWQKKGGELAEQTADVSAKQLSETWNRVLAQLQNKIPKDIIREALATMKFTELVEAWNEFVRGCDTRRLLSYKYLPCSYGFCDSYYIHPMKDLNKQFDGCSATYILDTLDHVLPHDSYYYQCDDPLADAYDNYASCSIPNSLDDFPYWNRLDDFIQYILDTGDTLHSDAIADALSAVAKLDTISFKEEQHNA